MAAYVPKSAVGKFFKAVNPFAQRPAPPAPSDEPLVDLHPHSFSCDCGPCVARTDALTRARLKRQGG